MNINIQKHKRFYALLVSFLLLASVGVMPTLAANIPTEFYQFKQNITVPTEPLYANMADGGGVILNATTSVGQVYLINIHVEAVSEIPNTDGISGYVFYTTSGNDRTNMFAVAPSLGTDTTIWYNNDFKFLEFDTNYTSYDPYLISWLENNGIFTSTSSVIDLPSIDFDFIFDSGILADEYVTFTNLLGGILTNDYVLSVFLPALFGLVLLSFIIFGKK